LERQFKTALFERAVLHAPKVTPAVTQRYPEALSVFRNAYAIEFLELPAAHAEVDLHRALLEQLRNPLVELGPISVCGSEFPLQVGDRDFALDLLFFHRGLNCLVAIELQHGSWLTMVTTNEHTQNVFSVSTTIPTKTIGCSRTSATSTDKEIQ